jgi:hypothetical protein
MPTKGRAPSIEHLRVLGKNPGLKKTETLIRQVQSAIEKWTDYADKAGVIKRTTKYVLSSLNGINRSSWPFSY